MKHTYFSVRARAKSFTHAWAGFKALLATEHNAYIHLGLTLAALALGCVLPLSAVESMLLLFAIALVWMAELFNTAIEKTADFISTERHPQIKLVKDLSAAAVLVAAVIALVVGCLIFIPKLF